MNNIFPGILGQDNPLIKNIYKTVIQVFKNKQIRTN